MDKTLYAKIRKCLALASSANEHEAAAALAKARALMEEHTIDAAQLDLADVDERASRGTRNERPPHWENLLSAAVQRAIGVICYLDANSDRCFVGKGAAPDIAHYAFQILFRHLKRERAAYIAKHLNRCKIGRKRLRADMFCQGWANGVYRKIDVLVPADSGARETLEKWLAEQKSDLVPVKARHATANGTAAARDYQRGFNKGQLVDLNHGVGSGSAPLALT